MRHATPYDTQAARVYPADHSKRTDALNKQEGYIQAVTDNKAKLAAADAMAETLRLARSVIETDRDYQHRMAPYHPEGTPEGCDHPVCNLMAETLQRIDTALTQYEAATVPPQPIPLHTPAP